MKKFLEFFWKSLLVGFGYTLALWLGGLLLSIFGFHLPAAMDPLVKAVWSLVGGILAGLCLGPIAASMPAARMRHLVVWGSVLFFNLASLAIEGFFFAPDLVGKSFPAMLLQQFIGSLVAGWIIALLFASPESIAPLPSSHPSALSWIWRFPAGALAYVFFYFFFGAANYILVTKPYYQAHAGGLTVPALSVTLTAEIIRSVLITLSVLPFLFTMRAGKKQLALQTGFILFAIGGLVPLTAQIGALPLFLLAASAVEIFFQNFSTGMVIAHLFGNKNAQGITQ